MTLLYAILALALLIVIHEAGHFLAARWCGMRVYEFAVGFGPKIISFTSKGVEYSIRWVPLGGYVRIAGMNPDEEDADHPEGFLKSAMWKRYVAIFAGPLANYIAAFAIFAFIYHRWGTPDDSLQIKSVRAGSAAATLGLKDGDRLLGIDGQAIKPTFGQDALLQMVVYLRQAVTGSQPKPVKLTILRGDAKRTITLPAEVARDFFKNAQASAIPYLSVRSYLPSDPASSKPTSQAAALQPTAAPSGAGAAPSGIPPLQAGDRLIKIGKQILENRPIFWRMLSERQKEEQRMILRRDGKIQTLVLPKTTAEKADPWGKDLHLEPATEVLLTAVASASSLGKAGLKTGDIILGIDDLDLVGEKPLVASEVLRKSWKKASAPVELVLLRGGKEPIRLKIQASQADAALEGLSFVLHPARAAQVMPNSTAATVGMKPGDLILSVDGQTITSVPQLLEAIQARAARPIRIVLSRQGQTLEKTIPAAAQPSEWRLGFQPDIEVPRLRTDLGDSMSQAIQSVWAWNLRIWDGLAKIVRGKEKANFTGPVGIVSMATQAVNQGLMFFLLFVSIISIHLAFFNLLPIPALDGGRILFLLFQQIARLFGVSAEKTYRLEGYVHLVGFLLLFGLLILITLKDVRGLFGF